MRTAFSLGWRVSVRLEPPETLGTGGGWGFACRNAATRLLPNQRVSGAEMPEQHRKSGSCTSVSSSCTTLHTPSSLSPPSARPCARPPRTAQLCHACLQQHAAVK